MFGGMTVSLGYLGMCKKEAEDNEMVIYSYSGENWNDGCKSQKGDAELYDGIFLIYKDCLEEPEIHTKLKRMPSGRKKIIEKRITHIPNIYEYIQQNKIVVEKECKNAFRRRDNALIDYIAERLIYHVFEEYQLNGILPDKARFIQ